MYWKSMADTLIKKCTLLQPVLIRKNFTYRIENEGVLWYIIAQNDNVIFLQQSTHF